MNQKERKLSRIANMKKYHTPACSNYIKRAKNAVYISPANSIEHEIAKLKVCYELRKNKNDFITEACRNKKDGNGKIRRVDIVNLDTGQEIEIETDPRRAKRFEGEKGVMVIELWKTK